MQISAKLTRGESEGVELEGIVTGASTPPVGSGKGPGLRGVEPGEPGVKPGEGVACPVVERVDL